jgi:hypothetical protein
MALKVSVQRVPFNWLDIDFGLGRGKRDDGTWCFWLIDGRRVDVEFTEKELILRVTTTADLDRPMVKIQNFDMIEQKMWRNLLTEGRV